MKMITDKKYGRTQTQWEKVLENDKKLQQTNVTKTIKDKCS